MKRHSLTVRHRELLAMPSIRSQLPVVYENGNQWDRIKFECVNCNKTLPADQVHGTLGKPFPTVAVLEAVGICVPCNVLTAFDWRLHNDKRVSGKRDGGWVTWSVRPSFLSRLHRLLTLPFTPKTRN